MRSMFSTAPACETHYSTAELQPHLLLRADFDVLDANDEMGRWAQHCMNALDALHSCGVAAGCQLLHACTATDDT